MLPTKNFCSLAPVTMILAMQSASKGRGSLSRSLKVNLDFDEVTPGRLQFQ
ncbi:hypothetical protein TIFTF001_005409 [Ficus carica]|uniref:Uncharacterized protein n=1 Tax=Ficus carica TaxID=3494 RepID=A0AA87ZNN4_FICCA|nr:hypothetical protein TIFTF001_005409 [Ficus carica]